jgi:hypothetical protein
MTLPAWLENPAAVAALLAALVSLLAALASLSLGRRQLQAAARQLDVQVKLKIKELDEQARLKRKELEADATRLRAESEVARQQQLTEVLKKRIETYRALYEIVSVYGRNWQIEGKPRDQAWAAAFLKALIHNNATNGAFFSRRVYDWYGRLRQLLEQLSADLAGRMATDQEIACLYDIIRGPVGPSGSTRLPGLGSYLKDELGSYVTVIVSAAYEVPTL